MSEQSLLKVSDFEWASVSRYIEYVSHKAGLLEVAESKIYNFRAPNGNFEALIRSKRRTYSKISDNMSNLEAFVSTHKEEIGESERVILRSFYTQWREALSLVNDHIERAQALSVIYQTIFTEDSKDEEFPF